MAGSFDALLKEVRGCSFCAAHLPLGPRPVVRMTRSARLLIIGQAPGTKVHESGLPWNDRSGDVLRDWLQMSRDDFYDETRIAIMPMGFCYPGVNPKGGDNPPRPECAPRWHDRLLAHLPDIRLTLLIGQYAQTHYLGKRNGKTMTETVQRFRDYLADGYFPLPHPSWRNLGWQKKQPWFAEETLPVLRRTVDQALAP
ncbi:MAG: uracil-DNA glycosylase family protein [Alphaproteobacteria bacterium]|nr:uracil-DNA glycosylase family protein [Alphaproteobacteria bacterium]